VSQSTVSLVLSGKSSGRVTAGTEELVRRAAQELGYRPNAAARTLRSGRTQTVALVVPNVAHPYFASMLLGAERRAREKEHAVMLVDAADDHVWRPAMAATLASRAVDGCIFYSAEPVNETFLHTLGRHVVVVEAHAKDAPSLLLDIDGGATAAMQHLLALGHTRIAHLGAAYPKETFRLRFSAYRRILRQAGIRVRDAYMAQSHFALPEARTAAGQLLDVSLPPTAIFCDDDLLAVGVYKAARDRSIRIPDDISVVGFDDIDIAQVLEPELTTVTLPAEQIGEAAIDLLLAAIEGREQAPASPIPLPLTIRRSTSRPPQ
jgi:DNA-binding LacI/PurR family transcriptional regulator